MLQILTDTALYLAVWHTWASESGSWAYSYGPIISAFPIYSPPASHSTLLVLLKSIVVLAHWSTLPEMHPWGLPWHSFILWDPCGCAALSYTALFTHSSPSPHWSTEPWDPAMNPKPCAVLPGALALPPPASDSAFALVPCTGTCYMISHMTGICNVGYMVSILKEKGKQEELQQDWLLVEFSVNTSVNFTLDYVCLICLFISLLQALMILSSSLSLKNPVFLISIANIFEAFKFCWGLKNLI